MDKAKDLAKNTAIISVGRICTQFMSFFLLPLYTSVLSTSEYGTVDLLISYSSLLLPIMTLAIEQALFRYLIDVRAEEYKKKSIISTAFIFTLVQSVICTLILCVVQSVVQKTYMPFFILMVIACIWSTTMLQLSRGLGDNVGYALGSFTTAAVQIICNILFLVVVKMGTNGMLLATFAGNLASSILLFFKTHTYKYVHFGSFSKRTLKEILKYSIPMIPNQLSWWIMNASDKTIVAIFLGTASNGLLAVSQKFPSMYMQFNSIFNISWTESAAQHINEDDAEEFFTEIINTVFKLFACACIGIIVCIPFVIGWLIDLSYFDSYYQIPIFMIASLCNVVVSLYGVLYVAYKKTKEIAKTALYAAIINAVSHLLMIYFIGLYAASISTLLGYGCMAIYRYYHSRKYLTVKISKRILLAIAIMLAVALVTYYLRIFLLQVIAFVFVLVMSIRLNIGMIKTVLTLCKKYLNKVIHHT